MYIGDLHIHSSFSRATSRECDAAHLDLWARKKGISLLGTGDFTHPAWRARLEEELVPAEEGLYTLKKELCLPDETAGVREAPRFVLSGEISSIYKKNGRVRKVHNVILLPSLESAGELSRRLEAIGNIHSDGRPILGLDSRDLLEITLDACPEAVFIPAHIWTPHFSLFGAFSGFDTMEECFEELTPHIHALETGLSSDPPMNWRVSQLDGYTLVSNSDAHSPQKLGREANLFDTGLSYSQMKRAIETGEGFSGTLEFFPEEGKYHLDGHRNCGVRLTPAETEEYGGKCPVCGKKITIGVEHRVEELADREEGYRPQGAKPFESLAPLPEVIAASTGVSEVSKKTRARYEEMLRTLGPEFYILREAPLAQVEQAAGSAVAEGIRRLREGKVERVAGYDGEFGSVILLTPSEIESLNGQTSLFGVSGVEPKKKAASQKAAKKPLKPEPEAERLFSAAGPNEEQLRAVSSDAAVIAVVAGPGTGKTKTLTDRIAHLISGCGVKPSEITAVTFTNQAAKEMRERLEQRLGGKRAVSGMTIGTFHAICLRQLEDVRLIGEAEALALAAQVLARLGESRTPRQFLQSVSRRKNGFSPEDAGIGEEALAAYQEALAAEGVLDFDDLLLRALEQGPRDSRPFSYLLVDEFQDCNDLQYELVRTWSREGKSLFVIGDPDQSIYGFRGAGGRCFERLHSDFPGLQQIRLLRNYRSTPEILDCALPVISKNGGEERRLLAQAPSGCAVRYFHAADDFSEAVFLAKEIARMTGGVDMLDAQQGEDREVYRSFSDIAVLCRTHRQLELVENCLRHDDIPCLVTGRGDFLQEDRVRGTVAFFTYLTEPGNGFALRDCLKLLWNCPASQAEEAARCCESVSSPGELGEKLGDLPALSEFLSCIEEFLPRRKEKPGKLLERWARKWEGEESLLRLGNMASFYGSLPEFLNALLLGEEDDLRRASGKSYSSGAVRLMTLHGSKGLEFPVVFLAGVKLGSLPLESPRRPSDPVEERRLFYVGMTRAREELILTAAEEPSPFLNDIPAGRLERVRLAVREKPAEQLSLF